MDRYWPPAQWETGCINIGQAREATFVQAGMLSQKGWGLPVLCEKAFFVHFKSPANQRFRWPLVLIFREGENIFYTHFLYTFKLIYTSVTSPPHFLFPNSKHSNPFSCRRCSRPPIILAGLFSTFSRYVIIFFKCSSQICT